MSLTHAIVDVLQADFVVLGFLPWPVESFLEVVAVLDEQSSMEVMLHAIGGLNHNEATSASYGTAFCIS